VSSAFFALFSPSRKRGPIPPGWVTANTQAIDFKPAEMDAYSGETLRGEINASRHSLVPAVRGGSEKGSALQCKTWNIILGIAPLPDKLWPSRQMTKRHHQERSFVCGTKIYATGSCHLRETSSRVWRFSCITGVYHHSPTVLLRRTTQGRGVHRTSSQIRPHEWCRDMPRLQPQVTSSLVQPTFT
jgi:hypothetical protein